MSVHDNIISRLSKAVNDLFGEYTQLDYRDNNISRLRQIIPAKTKEQLQYIIRVLTTFRDVFEWHSAKVLSIKTNLQIDGHSYHLKDINTPNEIDNLQELLLNLYDLKFQHIKDPAFLALMRSMVQYEGGTTNPNLLGSAFLILDFYVDKKNVQRYIDDDLSASDEMDNSDLFPFRDILNLRDVNPSDRAAYLASEGPIMDSERTQAEHEASANPRDSYTDFMNDLLNIDNEIEGLKRRGTGIHKLNYYLLGKKLLDDRKSLIKHLAKKHF